MKKIRWVALWGLLSFQPLFAESVQPSVTLSIDQAVTQALAYNLGLQTENLKSNIKKRDRNTAWNNLVPTLTATGALNRLNTVDQATTTGYLYDSTSKSMSLYSSQIDPWTVSGTIQMQWSFSFAVIRAINQTFIDYDNSLLSLTSARLKLERDVRKAYYQLIAMQEQIRISEKQLDNAEQRYKQTRAQFAAGLASNVTMLQSQVSYENKKPALDSQKLAYKQALMSFAYQLGLDTRTPITLTGSIDLPENIPDFDSNALSGKYLDRRFDIQTMSGNLKSLDNTVAIQQDLNWPSLVVNWTADPTIYDVFGAGKYSALGYSSTLPKLNALDSDNWAQRSGALTIMLRWQLDSLIPGLSTWTKVEDLKDQVAQARVGLEQTRRAAVMEIDNLVDNIRKSDNSLKTLALNVELAKKSYEQTERAYQAGSQTLVEVQDAEVEEMSAQFQVLNEELNLVGSLLDLQYALNTSRDDLMKGVK